MVALINEIAQLVFVILGILTMFWGIAIMPNRADGMPTPQLTLAKVGNMIAGAIIFATGFLGVILLILF